MVVAFFVKRTILFLSPSVSPKKMKRKRYESVVRKLLKWYQNPENFKKPLKTAAHELGYAYSYIRECVAKYGAEKFRQEREQIYLDILSESANIAIARLHEMLMSEDKEEFRQAQSEVRQWMKVLMGEKVDVRNKHEGELQLRIVHEVIGGPSSDVVSENQGDT